MHEIRTFNAKAIGDCCRDGESVKKFPYPLIYKISENTLEYPNLMNINMEDWESQMIEIVTKDAKVIIDDDCQRNSGSLYECNTRLYDVSVESREIPIPTPPIPTVTFSHLEEMIYDTYLKKYRVRLIPTSVTDAVEYMKEYGMPRSKKIPARGINIERYCIGTSWCFDTIKHATTFNKIYPKVASILSEIKVYVE